jgi:hypothetical protein
MPNEHLRPGPADVVPLLTARSRITLGTRLRRGIRFVNYEQQIIRPSAESTGRSIRILNAVLRPMLEQQSQRDSHVLSAI